MTFGPVFDKDHMPEDFEFEARLFKKKVYTKMARIDGPFTVHTVHLGPVHCEDGWLAVDAHGYPYPIDVSEHDDTYQELKDSEIA